MATELPNNSLYEYIKKKKGRTVWKPKDAGLCTYVTVFGGCIPRISPETEILRPKNVVKKNYILRAEQP